MVGRHTPATYLFDYLDFLKAKTIVIEPEYVDGDYLEDFASYYVKCYKDYDRKCKRLHFFDCDLSDDQLHSTLLQPPDPNKESPLNKHYLGFSVARPLPDAIVGRTVLRTYPGDGGRRNYTCLRKYTANLFGTDLTLESLAFQEQDTVLAACATVALWCCLHKTADLYGGMSPRPAVITQLANQVVHQSRPIPSHGLIVEQLCNAIRKVSLEPEVIQIRPYTPLLSLLYGHVSMGNPVILGMRIEGRGRHAVAVTGYSLKDSPVHSQEVGPKEACAPMKGLRIDEFYVHDDQFGPFSRLRVMPSVIGQQVTYPVTFEGAWKDDATGKQLRLYPEVVIVPVYNKLRVTFFDVAKHVELLDALVGAMFHSSAREWDIRATTTNRYKNEIRSKRELPESLRLEIITESQPRFIWVAGLAINGKEAFELLFDATDMGRSLPAYKVMWLDDSVKAKVRGALLSATLRPVLLDLLGEPLFDLLVVSAN